MFAACVVLCLLHQGVSTHIKLKAAGELQDSGKREVYFEANGVPRVVEVIDKKSLEVLGKTAIREKVRRTGSLGWLRAGQASSPWKRFTHAHNPC
jgi:pyruvate carboxylase